MAERLSDRIQASEARHTGEVRICVEASLPLHDLYRLGRDATLATVIRDRAWDWFGDLRVWDTERNNGVLIYLLLAEQAIEVVADRALSRAIDQQQWEAIVGRLGQRLKKGEVEDGLTAALEEVSALLVEAFPLGAGEVRPDELPNFVVRA
ncbi:TPM domain-containing protein [Hydrogenophaga sp. 5NK40-0174]|uniref:TPM domain-containing protein n=1 Tax=Hydrogenophaga sp. 5NK40-0174 TaxID=3127649 RepID=UPI00333F8EB8